MSLPDRVKPISGRPDRPAESPDLSCAAPAAASPITASAAINRRSHRTRLPLISLHAIRCLTGDGSVRPHRAKARRFERRCP